MTQIHPKDEAIFAEMAALGAAIRGRKSKSLRNLPCPCSSGRKYKKCCGSAVRKETGR